jgi:hypothetical protein
MRNSNDGRIGMLDEDGKIRVQADIKERKQESQTQIPPNNLRYF